MVDETLQPGEVKPARDWGAAHLTQEEGLELERRFDTLLASGPVIWDEATLAALNLSIKSIPRLLATIQNLSVSLKESAVSRAAVQQEAVNAAVMANQTRILVAGYLNGRVIMGAPSMRVKKSAIQPLLDDAKGWNLQVIEEADEYVISFNRASKIIVPGGNEFAANAERNGINRINKFKK